MKVLSQKDNVPMTPVLPSTAISNRSVESLVWHLSREPMKEMSSLKK